MYLVTTTLLNSWQYLWKVDEEYQESAWQDFIDLLNKVRKPPNDAMIRGIEFEADCIAGLVPGISEIIKGGTFQYAASKETKVAGERVLLYGKIDVLKAGIIYDIKSTSKYELQKYHDSTQHHMYMNMIPNAVKFVYLINNGNDTFQEIYRRDEIKPVEPIIAQFYEWLKDKNLWNIYTEKWQTRQG
jgi:hypothetical protein